MADPTGSAAGAFDAVVLCGGSARRLGGLDKPGLVVGSRTLLDTVLTAVDGAAQIVCVGPERPAGAIVRWCREDPPGGGPVAALAAALPLVTAPTVVLLAADLPRLTRDDVQALLAQGRAAVLVDEDGREQWLAGCWPTTALRDALGTRTGGPLREVLSSIPVVRLLLPGGPWTDVDTDDDLRRARSGSAGQLG